jgi:hypothetical protein
MGCLVGADTLLSFGRSKGMSERVTARFLLDAGLLEILGDELSHATLGNRLVLVVEKKVIIGCGGARGQVILDRLGNFAFQFNAPGNHAFAGTNMQDTLSKVNIVKLEGNQFRHPETSRRNTCRIA